MRLHVGCAMWRHAAWQTGRAPAASEALRMYARSCDAVEGNTTFYATPSPDTVASWARQTPPDFRFLMKLPRPITHDARLRGAEAPLGAFLDVMAPLGPRVHAWWIQLPATFGPTDLGALAGFLHRAPSGLRWAVEVRHPAFFAEPRVAGQLERVLGRVDAEWVTFDTTVLFDGLPVGPDEQEAWSKKPRLPRRDRALTEFPVVRYHGRDDVERTVRGWEPWLDTVTEWLREGRSPTVFVHTPDNASALALSRRFHDAVRARLPELAPLTPSGQHGAPDSGQFPESEASAPMTLF